MSGDTCSAKDVFIMTRDWVFDDVGANTTVKTLADNLLKPFIFIASVVRRHFLSTYRKIHSLMLISISVVRTFGSNLFLKNQHLEKYTLDKLY